MEGFENVDEGIVVSIKRLLHRPSKGEEEFCKEGKVSSKTESSKSESKLNKLKDKPGKLSQADKRQKK